MEITIIEAACLIVTSLVVPYVVALIRNNTLTGTKARWLAIGVSIVAGIVAGFVGGIPTTAVAWVTCVFASIGGTQTAYTLFKSVGITSGWLDALMEIGNGGDQR